MDGNLEMSESIQLGCLCLKSNQYNRSSSNNWFAIFHTSKFKNPFLRRNYKPRVCLHYLHPKTRFVFFFLSKITPSQIITRDLT